MTFLWPIRFFPSGLLPDRFIFSHFFRFTLATHMLSPNHFIRILNYGIVLTITIFSTYRLILPGAIMLQMVEWESYIYTMYQLSTTVCPWQRAQFEVLYYLRCIGILNFIGRQYLLASKSGKIRLSLEKSLLFILLWTNYLWTNLMHS